MKITLGTKKERQKREKMGEGEKRAKSEGNQKKSGIARVEEEQQVREYPW